MEEIYTIADDLLRRVHFLTEQDDIPEAETLEEEFHAMKDLQETLFNAWTEHRARMWVNRIVGTLYALEFQGYPGVVKTAVNVVMNITEKTLRVIDPSTFSEKEFIAYREKITTALNHFKTTYRLSLDCRLADELGLVMANDMSDTASGPVEQGEVETERRNLKRIKPEHLGIVANETGGYDLYYAPPGKAGAKNFGEFVPANASAQKDALENLIKGEAFSAEDSTKRGVVRRINAAAGELLEKCGLHCDQIIIPRDGEYVLTVKTVTTPDEGVFTPGLPEGNIDTNGKFHGGRYRENDDSK